MDIKALGLHDIYLFQQVPFWQTHWFMYTLIVLALVGISIVVAVMIRLYYRRSKKVLTPQEKALKQLEKLQSKNMICTEKSVDCYHALTQILKEYISVAYNEPINNKTDREVGVYFASHVNKKLFMPVDLIFSNGIRVKFSHEKVTTDRVQNDYNRVKRFIRNGPLDYIRVEQPTK